MAEEVKIFEWIPVGEKSSRYREEEEREHWPEQGYEIGEGE